MRREERMRRRKWAEVDSRASKEFQSRWMKMDTRTSEGREVIEGAASTPASAVWLILLTEKSVFRNFLSMKSAKLGAKHESIRKS
jgi:hypothetical protein